MSFLLSISHKKISKIRDCTMIKNNLVFFTLLSCWSLSLPAFATVNDCIDANVQSRLDAGESPIAIYNRCSSNISLLYGKRYQGGLIAYLNTTIGEGYGSGFVAAPTDFSMSALWMNYGQGYYAYAGATGTQIGTGKNNTSLIVQKLGTPTGNSDLPASLYNYAAWISQSNFNGYSDWYLPSQDEMIQVVNFLLKKVGGCDTLKNYGYWTSTEPIGSDGKTATSVNCSGSSSSQIKNSPYSVRMIRAFGASAELTTTQTMSIVDVTLNGSFSNLGTATVVSKGICYGQSPYPTLSGSVAQAGSGSANFSVPMLGYSLTPGGTYYARACATVMSSGSQTALYGNQLQFVYPQPVVTRTPSNVTQSTARLGGSLNIPANFQPGSNTFQFVEISNPATPDASPVKISFGLFGADFTGDVAYGLSPATRYDYKAGVILYDNSNQLIGTLYGANQSFTTQPAPTLPVSNPPFVGVGYASDVPATSLPPDTKMSCTNSTSGKGYCDFVHGGNGVSYWVLSPVDNSYYMILAAYSSYKNQPVATQKFYGARYNGGISVDAATQTISIMGDPNGYPIVVPWSLLTTP